MSVFIGGGQGEQAFAAAPGRVFTGGHGRFKGGAAAFLIKLPGIGDGAAIAGCFGREGIGRSGHGIFCSGDRGGQGKAAAGNGKFT